MNTRLTKVLRRLIRLQVESLDESVKFWAFVICCQIISKGGLFLFVCFLLRLYPPPDISSPCYILFSSFPPREVERAPLYICSPKILRNLCKPRAQIYKGS